MPTLTWLHLSDVHLPDGSADSYRVDKVLRALLKTLAEEEITPDLIFFTGDLADKGRDYVKAREFCDDLLIATRLTATLRDRARQRLFVVPGNHDVDRRSTRYVTRSLSNREEADSFFAPDTPREVVFSRFHAFQQFFNDYFHDIRRIDAERHFYSEVLSIPTIPIRVGIVGLNSALFSADDHDQEKLWIGERTCDIAFETIDRAGGADLIFALQHHPYTWLHPEDAPHVKGISTERADICLYGHLHRPETEQVKDQHGHVLRFQSGAMYDRSPWPYRFLWGIADLDTRRVRIKPMTYQEGPPARWVLDTGLFPHRAPHHTETFELPRRVVRTTLMLAEAPKGSGNIARVLTEGVVGLPGGLATSVEQFLHEYLGVPDKPVPFGGRDTQMRELDEWLIRGSLPYGLVAAEAGRGKSALVTRWAARVAAEQRCDVVFAPVSIRFGTALRTAVIPLLGGRLAHLHGSHVDAPTEIDRWSRVIDIYLRRDRPPDRPLLIVLDGIDEAIGWVCGRDLRFPPQPGRNVKVLVSARVLAEDRDTGDWLRRLEWHGIGTVFTLPRLNREGIVHVLGSLGDPLAGLTSRIDVVGELLRLSLGEPLLVKLYVDALVGVGINAGFLRPEDLRQLNPGIGSYFRRWWEDQLEQWGATQPLREASVQSILNALACALGPLRKSDLRVLTRSEGLTGWTLDEALRPLQRFIVGDGERHGYVFSHPRLAQYFYEERLTASERKEWNQRFIDYGRLSLTAHHEQREMHAFSPYLLRCFGAHLERGEASPGDFYGLVTEPWLRGWEGLDSTYSGFLGDVERAWRQADVDRHIGVQLRSALCRSSVNAFTGKLPVDLLKAAVQAEVIRGEEALEVSRGIANERGRIRMLAELFPVLDGSSREAALAQILTGTEPSERARALINIAPVASGGWYQHIAHEALLSTSLVSSETERAGLLDAFANLSKISGLEELALRAIGELGELKQRVGPIVKLLRHLPPERCEAIHQESAQRILDLPDARERLFLLAELGEVASLDFVRDLVSKFEALSTLADRTSFLGLLARRLIVLESLDDAVRVAHLIAKGAANEVWAEIATLAFQQNRPETGLSALQQMDPVSRAIRLGDIVRSLGVSMPDELIAKTFDESLKAEYPLSRADAALAIIQQMSPQSRERATRILRDVIQGIVEPAQLAPRLAALGKLTAGDDGQALFEAAIHAADRVIRPTERATVLVDVSKSLPRDMAVRELSRAFAVICQAWPSRDRVRALVILAPHLVESERRDALRLALRDARRIDDAVRVQGVLEYVARQLLQMRCWPQGLAAARLVRDGMTRSKLLLRIAPHLTAQERYPIVQLALESISERNNRVFMREIAGDAELREGLTFVASTADVAELLSYDGRCVSAWIAEAREAESPEARATEIAAIAKLVPSRFSGRVFQDALRQLHRPRGRGRMDSGALTERGYAKVLFQLIDDASAESFSPLRQQIDTIQVPSLRDDLLGHLAARCMESNGIQEAERALGAIGNVETIFRVAISSIERLTPASQVTAVRIALDAARSIRNGGCRADALIAMLPHLPTNGREQVLSEARAAAMSIRAEGLRLRVYDQIANAATTTRLSGSEESGGVRGREGGRASSTAMADTGLDSANTGLFGESLESSWDSLRRVQAIVEDARRDAALLDLVPRLARAARSTEAFEAAHGIRDPAKRSLAFSRLAPSIRQPYRSEALKMSVEAVSSIQDESVRASALVETLETLGRDGGSESSVIELAHKVWAKTLRECAQHARPVFWSDFEKLVQAIVGLTGAKWADEIVMTITDINEWWP